MGKLADGTLFAPKYLENKLKFFPYIKEAVCFGHDRATVCAFINIDPDAVGNWAEKRNMPYSGYTDLASRDEVYDLVRGCIEQVNSRPRAPSRRSPTRRSTASSSCTRSSTPTTASSRARARCAAASSASSYDALVEALYAGKNAVHVEAQVKYEDGRTGTFSADLKIRDAKTFAPAAAQESAA